MNGTSLAILDLPTRHSHNREIGGQSPLLLQPGASARAFVGAGSARRSQDAHIVRRCLRGRM